MSNFEEHEPELGLLKHLEMFLLGLGGGFAFVGRQYPLAVSDQDYYERAPWNFAIHGRVIWTLTWSNG